MLHALHPTSCMQAANRTRRLAGLPRAKFVFAARWVVTVLAFWVVLHSIDLGAVVDLIGRAAPLALGVAGLVVIAQFAVLVWRWQLVIHILGGKSVGFVPLSVFLGHSFLVGQVLPSSVGGDVARTVMLARLTGAAAAARSVVCDRLIGFAGLALLVVPTLPIIAGKMGGLTLFLALTIAALGTMAAVALALAAPAVVHAVPWMGRPLAVVAGDLRLALRSGNVSLVAVALAVGSNLLAVLLIYIFGLAIGADMRGLDCLVFVPPALLASSVPISLGGWGVREGALLAAFSLVHADPAGVAATSVMVGLTMPLTGAVVVAASLFAGWRNILPKGSRDGG
jgi:glycosyltransferase 2 family protein